MVPIVREGKTSFNKKRSVRFGDPKRGEWALVVKEK
jgi:hypothetical protein